MQAITKLIYKAVKTALLFRADEVEVTADLLPWLIDMYAPNRGFRFSRGTINKDVCNRTSRVWYIDDASI